MHSTLATPPPLPLPALSRRRTTALRLAIPLAVVCMVLPSKGRAEDGLQPGTRQRLNDEEFVLRHPQRTRIQWTCTLYGRLRPDETRTRIVGAPLAGRLARVVTADGEMVVKGALLLEVESEQLASLQRDWKAGMVALKAALAELASMLSRNPQQAPVSGRTADQNEVSRLLAEKKVEDMRRELEKLRVRADLIAARANQPTGVGVLERGEPGRIGVLAPATGQAFMAGLREARPVDDRGDAALARILDTSVLVAELDLPERLIEYVSRGQHVEAVVDELRGQSFGGVIVSAGSTVSRETGTILVRTEFVNPQQTLKFGMHANVTIQFTGNRPVLTLPPLALVPTDKGPAVWKLVGGGGYELRRVHTGYSRVGFVEVIDGISESDFIALPKAGAHANGAVDSGAGASPIDCRDATTSATME